MHRSVRHDSVAMADCRRRRQTSLPLPAKCFTHQAASTLAFGPAGISANVGRVPQGNNVILDTTNDEDKWRELDMQVRAASRACCESVGHQWGAGLPAASGCRMSGGARNIACLSPLP